MTTLNWQPVATRTFHDEHGARFREYEDGRIEPLEKPTGVVETGLGGAHVTVSASGEACLQSDRPSWVPVDLTGVLAGTHVAPVPTLLRRDDGIGLLYPGLTHSFHGESESGKSLLLQFECARQVNAGHDALFIDFESDQETVVGRLETFGARPEAILKHFYYVRPDADPYQVASERLAWNELLSRPYKLAVIDGVTDALTVFGYATKDNDGIAQWNRRVPRHIADRTGAATALIDHVTKDSSGRGRFAIGGQAKMNSLTGAAYTVEIDEPLAPGLRGVIVLRVAKDRPGSVRDHCGPFQKADRTQEAARVVVDSRDPNGVVVTVEAPGTTGVAAKPFRPTNLMERASKVVEDTPGLTKTAIADLAKGNKQVMLQAIDLLVTEGHFAATTDIGKYPVHTLVRPYRQVDDPQSDTYRRQGTTLTASQATVVPGSLPREPGTTSRAVPGTTEEPRGTNDPNRMAAILSDAEWAVACSA